MIKTNVTDDGLPPGGTTGQIPKKQSSVDYDIAWEDDGLPPGSVAFSGVVENFAALPAAATVPGELYYIKNGILPWNERKGTVFSEGGVWERAGGFELKVYDTEAKFIDDGTSNELTLELGNLTANRILTLSDEDLDLAAIPSQNIAIDILGTPTYSNAQDLLSLGNSAGAEADGVTYISDAGGATIDVAAGQGLIRSTDSSSAQLFSFDWTASNGIAIPSDTRRYIGIEYNAGTPQVSVRTTQNWDCHTSFELGEVVNEGGVLHLFNNPVLFNDVNDHVIHRLYETERLQRAARLGGIILGETGTRNVTLSAGELYDRLNEFPIAAFDTSVTDSFDSYSSAGQESTGNTQWDNDNYDNAGTLTTLNNNRYANLWFYVESDSDIVCVYGTAQYVSSATAESEAVPTVLPLRLQSHGRLVGRYIFQKGAGTADEIQSAFAEQFGAALASVHANLSGLTADDHPNDVFLPGRSGGQTLYGGIDASDDLTLYSTSNATKGTIILGGDTTIQGHLLTMGDAGAAVDTVISFLGLTNSSNLTYDESEDIFGIGSSGLSTTGIVTAEHLTSTDDITMQGHLMNLGNAGSSTDTVINFLASGNSGSITWDQSLNEFNFNLANVRDIVEIGNISKIWGDGNTYIEWPGSDTMNVWAGGLRLMEFVESGGEGTITVNDDSNVVDFVIKGDTEPNMLKTDAATGMVTLGGGLSINTVRKTSNYTTALNDQLIACAGTFTVTLSPGSFAQRIVIVNTGTGTITVDGDSAEEISGSLTQTLTNQWESITIVWETSQDEWLITSDNR